MQRAQSEDDTLCGKCHVYVNETIYEDLNTKIGTCLRKDNVLLHETDPLVIDTYIINISTSETFTLNRIYDTNEPSPTPVPISIRVDHISLKLHCEIS